MRLLVKTLLLGCMLHAPLAMLADGRKKPAPTDTPASQQEKLDRGFIRINNTIVTAFLSWRYLYTDNEHTSFIILKNGVALKDTLRNTTCYRPSGIVRTSEDLKLVVLQNGVPTDTVSPYAFSDKTHHTLQLDRPEKSTDDSRLKDSVYYYTPNDCSVGDVDGDGQYELFVKWYPSNAKDNSQGGYTGYTYIDCYKLFPNSGEVGKKLWRINLGKNIRSGAHYTQYLVYDFDGDGKAELICKTAPGSIDGTGKYVSEAATNASVKSVSNTKDWRVSGGRVNGGYEFLTVFNGETGAAIHTIPYMPNRNATFTLSDAAGTFNWYITSGKSDTGSYGNRGERYLAGVAYLDGPDARPSAVMCRGMYTRSHLWAVDFDGKELSTKWIHASLENNVVERYDANGNKTKKTYTKNDNPFHKSTHATYNAFGQGAHSLTIGDVDGDGCDEIIYGSATVDNDGWMLYSTGYGHGDAEHLGDLNPDRPGLEIFMVHEENPYGAHYIDAATGEVLWATTGSADNGRGLAANIIADRRGYEFWSAKVANTYNVKSLTTPISTYYPSMNFRIFWDGDPEDELLDGTSIRKYSYDSFTSKISSKELGVYTSEKAMKTFGSLGLNLSSCNSTKATPCLQADILGDWREEVIWWNSSDPSQIFIFSSTEMTDYRVPSLMFDHNYRMAIAWQQTGYNQPPHLGYYLPDYIDSFQGVADDPAVDVPSLPQRAKSVTGREYYTIGGQRIEKGSARPGVVIERVRYSDGTQAVKKHIAH